MTELEKPSWQDTAEPAGWREPDGRFKRGNAASPGSGALRRAHEINGWFRDASSKEHVTALYSKLYELAMGGDVQAAKVLLERLGGKPSQAISLENDGDGTTIIQVVRTALANGTNP